MTSGLSRGKAALLRLAGYRAAKPRCPRRQRYALPSVLLLPPEAVRGAACGGDKLPGSVAAWAPLAVCAVLLVLPDVSEACAVCFQAKSDESRQAFIWTTAFMTALPLAMIAGFVGWLRHRFKVSTSGLSRGEAALPATAALRAASGGSNSTEGRA